MRQSEDRSTFESDYIHAHAGHLALAEPNKPCPWIVSAWLSWWAWLNSQFFHRTCSDVQRVVPQCAVYNLLKSLNCSAVQYNSIRSIYHNHACSFRLNLLGVQCTCRHGSVAISIVSTRVLSPPSNCTRMLAPSEITNVTIVPVGRIQGSMVFQYV